MTTRKLTVVNHSREEEIPPVPRAFADAEFAPNLCDTQGRLYRYLRASVIDRCDFACVYCMPPGGEEHHARRSAMLSFEELCDVVSVFAEMGTERVRLTGGEPLVRKDIVELIRKLRSRLPEIQIAMTSNAGRLADLAADLRSAGLNSINISLDSLDAARFARLTRGGKLTQVLAGVDEALRVGLEVKLNTVAMRGENDDEFARIVDFAWERSITPRFIELMPIGEGAKLPFGTYISSNEIAAKLGVRVRSELEQSAGPTGPARYARSQLGAGRHRVGFITAMSDSFCQNCNRVRLTSSGDIRACIASRRAISLRDIMRPLMEEGGATELGHAGRRELAWAIHWALRSKDAGHMFWDSELGDHAQVAMSSIGG